MSEQQYLDIMQNVLNSGYNRPDRTGVGSRFLVGDYIKWNMSDGFPIITTKHIPFKSVVGELLWMLEGSTDERRLAEITFGTRDLNQKTIWTANAVDFANRHNDDYTDLGLIYGSQLRRWGHPSAYHTIDQIKNIINSIKTNPFSRRHIVTHWNPSDLDDDLVALPPCHILWQCNVIPNENGDPYGIELSLYQRSCDLFLGIPWNITFYSLLLYIIAAECDLVPIAFNHFMNDIHIYNNQFEQVKEQISRKPSPEKVFLKFDKKPLFDSSGKISYTVDDFSLENYNPQSKIRAKMAV